MKYKIRRVIFALILVGLLTLFTSIALLTTGDYLLTDENGNDFVEQAREFEY